MLLYHVADDIKFQVVKNSNLFLHWCKILKAEKSPGKASSEGAE